MKRQIKSNTHKGMMSESEVKELYESYIRVFVRTNRDSLLSAIDALSKVLGISSEEEAEIFKRVESELNK